ncbi:MAG: ATP-dependent DNA helicase [Burkholderiaceae bacterium]
MARPGQQRLASAVGEAIQHQSMLVAEAGTGTGKTYAYLVPALLCGGRVLISTGTRNLQDQLFARDLPRVREALGVSANVALLKGRSNYVCRYHLKRHLAEGRFARRADIVDLRRIELFSKVSLTGDRGALTGVAEDAPAWAMATSTRDNCLGQECPDFDQCFVYKARQQAQDADIIVVNHHLFCADLALKDEGISELLPTVSAVIFDEAHQLPEVATQFFGSAVSTRQLVEFGRDVLRCGLADARDQTDWTELAARIEQAVRDWRLQAGPPARLDSQAARRMPELLQAIGDAHAEITAAGEVLAQAAVRSKDLARCALRANELAHRLGDWLTRVVDESTARRVPDGAAEPSGSSRLSGSSAALSESSGLPGSAGSVGASGLSGSSGSVGASGLSADSGSVRSPGSEGSPGPSAGGDAGLVVEGRILWADVGQSGCTLHATPLSVAEAFTRHREQRPRAWVFLSATLAIGGSLDFFSRSLGLEGARTMIVDSPFDYQHQALLYVPQGLGDPLSRDYAERLAQAVWPLIVANGGRAFVLCTTLRMVERLAELLARRIAADAPSLLLLRQGEGTRGELLDRFREHPAPVLVGSASFWEGVDVQGAQLSLVIIDKLPFAPPDDPIVRARSEAVRRAGYDPFRRLHLPATAMALKQGAGRLIRSETDRGLLVVCDARLADKPYGRSMLRSLPPFRRTRSADDALRFVSGDDAPAADPADAQRQN